MTSAEQVTSNAAVDARELRDEQLSELAEIGRPTMSCPTFAP